MPLIQVTAAQGTLNRTEQHSLMSRLSNAVLKAEGAPIKDKGAQSLVWAYYDEKPINAIYVGGTFIGNPPLRIDITTPEGALHEATRHSLVEEIGEITDNFIGPFEGRQNHWAMLYEVSDGSWAGGGEVFPLAGIQSAMNIKAG